MVKKKEEIGDDEDDGDAALVCVVCVWCDDLTGDYAGVIESSGVFSSIEERRRRITGERW